MFNNTVSWKEFILLSNMAGMTFLSFRDGLSFPDRLGQLLRGMGGAGRFFFKFIFFWVWIMVISGGMKAGSASIDQDLADTSETIQLSSVIFIFLMLKLLFWVACPDQNVEAWQGRYRPKLKHRNATLLRRSHGSYGSHARRVHRRVYCQGMLSIWS